MRGTARHRPDDQAAVAASAPGARERLLAVAGRLFAEHGFGAVKTRLLASAASVNIAAINYYFGSKEGLYRETVLAAHRRSTDRFLAELSDTRVSAQERLRTFIHGIVHSALDPQAYGMRLLARELVAQSDALDDVVNLSIRPVADRLKELLGEIAGTGVPPERLRHACASIIGQCLYWMSHRPVIERLQPEERFDPVPIAEDIIAFSLRGLHGLAQSPAASLAPAERLGQRTST